MDGGLGDRYLGRQRKIVAPGPASFSCAGSTFSGSALDGKKLAQLLVGGFLNLQDNMDRLNKENEFPIPDNDTGTNMVICCKRSVRNLIGGKPAEGGDLVEVSQQFADDVSASDRA